MSEFFLKIVNMSITAGWLVLAVMLLRILLRKAPKWIAMLLWGLVAIRLICPFSMESAMSLIPSAETISPEIMTDPSPQIHTGISVFNHAVNPIIEDSFAPAPGASVNPLQIWIPVVAVLWIAGIVAMLLYTAISYLRIRRRIAAAVLLRDNIFQSENVASPFVLGIMKPKIYLPFYMNEQDMEYVIAHEKAHIRRWDHWWKPFGFLLLSIYWFNPFLWIAYAMLCRDIELACDEKVVKELNREQKADYSQALLTCSVNRRMTAACPLAFGEVGVKNRVRSVLNYKKPAFWLILFALVVSAVVAVCFLTNPQSDIDDGLSVFLDMQIAEHHYREGETEGHLIVTDYKVLDFDRSFRETTVYLWVLYREYSCDEGIVRMETSSYLPTVITAKQTGTHGHYSLEEYWVPRDIETQEAEILEKFPTYLHDIALNPNRYFYEQSASCDRSAEQYFADEIYVADSLNVISSIEDMLKNKFPMYYDLPTDKGLEIYIWQMAEGSYSCGLLPGTDQEKTNEEIWTLHQSPASMNEMRLIIASYIEDGVVTKDEVIICPVPMPHSSYYYTIDEAYKQEAERLFWSVRYMLSGYPCAVLDQATFDIDADGRMEDCYLYHGPTSGVFTFCLDVFENEGEKNRYEYFNIFSSTSGDIFFAETKDGMKLRLVPQFGTAPIDYSFSVRDGNIVLTADGEELPYWGEQGTDSPFASLIIE